MGRRRKNEFRQDTFRKDILGKLLLTKRQRQTFLRWFLFATVCVVALIVQDVIMSRVRIFDTTTDLGSYTDGNCFVIWYRQCFR